MTNLGILKFANSVPGVLYNVSVTPPPDNFQQVILASTVTFTQAEFDAITKSGIINFNTSLVVYDLEPATVIANANGTYSSSKNRTEDPVTFDSNATFSLTNDGFMSISIRGPWPTVSDSWWTDMGIINGETATYG